MKNLSVWLVDDMKAINLINTHILQKLPEISEIQSFTNPNDFLENFHARDIEGPDVVLIDINMPQMNGFELLNELEQDQKGTAVFILTTSINPSDKTQSEQYENLKGFLLKPLSVEMIKRDIFAKI